MTDGQTDGHRPTAKTALVHTKNSELKVQIELFASWDHKETVRQFLPRDTMRKRGLCCRPVSVRLSVSLVHCIHTAKDVVKVICRPLTDL